MAASVQILIVEDDEDVRNALCECLGERYRVESAENGSIALDLLRAGVRPDVILLDLMMPVMNGWELAGALRQDPRLRSIPIIVLSACGQPLLHELGVTETLRKPVRMDEVVSQISRIIDGAERIVA
jgi:CheY-like chemotaxis protein